MFTAKHTWTFKVQLSIIPALLLFCCLAFLYYRRYSYRGRFHRFRCQPRPHSRKARARRRKVEPPRIASFFPVSLPSSCSRFVILLRALAFGSVDKAVVVGPTKSGPAYLVVSYGSLRTPQHSTRELFTLRVAFRRVLCQRACHLQTISTHPNSLRIFAVEIGIQGPFGGLVRYWADFARSRVPSRDAAPEAAV
jgi:hypothetical protein